MPAQGPSQQAAVIFYTSGTGPGIFVPGGKHGVFGGSIFDGNQALFQFLGSSSEKNQHRFIKVALPAGQHSFAASYSKDAAHDDHVSVTLEAGHSYYFRTNTKLEGVIVTKIKGLVEPVSCQTAHEELGDAKALVPRTISPELTATLDSTAPLPACP